MIEIAKTKLSGSNYDSNKSTYILYFYNFAAVFPVFPKYFTVLFVFCRKLTSLNWSDLWYLDY